MYAVTVSDGTTTVGALPWIDFYGEQSTSGFHYNKIQVALNSGTSVGKNKATVHRYDAFYENGSVKPRDYTVTVYADGFAPLTATVTVPTLSGKLDKDITGADTYVANKDNYTEASYAAFEEALTKAKEVAAKSNATDEEITEARKALSDAEKALVTKVTLKAKAKKVKAGKSLKLTATVKTSKAKPVNKTLKWTSSNTKYATVNNKGLVKAKEAGKGKTVKIMVQSTDGTNKKKSVKIKIN